MKRLWTWINERWPLCWKATAQQEQDVLCRRHCHDYNAVQNDLRTAIAHNLVLSRELADITAIVAKRKLKARA